MDGRCRHCGARERSSRSHDHFFARVAAAWEHLPEWQRDRFPTAEALRKWCLIKAGFRNERTVVFPSPEEAARATLFGSTLDDYAVVVAEGCLVHVYTAKSQKVRRKGSDDGMDRKEFQASKDAVFEVIAALIGVTVDELPSPSIVPDAPTADPARRREAVS